MSNCNNGGHMYQLQSWSVLTSPCEIGPARTCPRMRCGAWCVTRWCWGFVAVLLLVRRTWGRTARPVHPRTCPIPTQSWKCSASRRGGSRNHPLPPHHRRTRPGCRLRWPFTLHWTLFALIDRARRETSSIIFNTTLAYTFDSLLRKWF